MKAYKGFNKDLKCRDFQFEVGKEYTEDKASLCDYGFHACEHPLDCFKYYEPSQSRYCEVDIDDNRERRNDDTKVCGTRIKIGAEIGIPGLVKAAIEYVTEKANPSNRHHTTGYGSANLSTGYKCSNEGNGERNICIGWGKNNKCKGAIGSFLVLSEWGEWNGKQYPFISAKMVEVDGEIIKEDTYYMLVNGEIKEVE